MNKYRKKYRTPVKAFSKGWSGGYTEHRYGEKRQVRMPVLSIQKKALNKDRKRHAIYDVLDLLKDWRFNRWENESPVRHGLRQALCVDGWSWQDADDEAADIVNKSFIKLGRGRETRPTEDEADELHLIARENCLGCNGPLTEAQIAMNIRCCDIDCARMVYFRRSYASGAYNSEYGKAAYSILYRDKFEEKECARVGCTNVFKSEFPDQRYCSKACKSEAQRIHYECRECALDGCTTVFEPNTADQRFCCQQHGAMANATVPLRQCALDGCTTWFKPKHKQEAGSQRGMYCSPAHARAARSTRIHDLECQLCGDPFTASMPNAKTCCDAHYQILRKIEKGQWPKRLNAGVFDYLFRQKQKVLTPDLFDGWFIVWTHPIHRLFE